MLRYILIPLLVFSLIFLQGCKQAEEKKLNYWEAFNETISYKSDPCITRSSLDNKRFLMQTEKGVYQSFDSTKSWIPWKYKPFYEACDSVALPYPVFFGPHDSSYFQVNDSVYNEKGGAHYAFDFMVGDSTWFIISEKASHDYFAIQKFPLPYLKKDVGQNYWSLLILKFRTNLESEKDTRQDLLVDTGFINQYIKKYELIWCSDIISIEKNSISDSVFYTTPKLQLYILDKEK